MKPVELKKLREANKISRIELAANAGLPSGFIAQIEEEEAVPLESDLQRLERAIHRIVQQRDQDEEAE